MSERVSDERLHAIVVSEGDWPRAADVLAMARELDQLRGWCGRINDATLIPETSEPYAVIMQGAAALARDGKQALGKGTLDAVDRIKTHLTATARELAEARATIARLEAERDQARATTRAAVEGCAADVAQARAALGCPDEHRTRAGCARRRCTALCVRGSAAATSCSVRRSKKRRRSASRACWRGLIACWSARRHMRLRVRGRRSNAAHRAECDLTGWQYGEADAIRT